MLTNLSTSELHALMPHSGDMCLINKVLSVDDTAIEALAEVEDPDSHPLACDNRLSVLLLPEFAAQAAALHLNGSSESVFGVTDAPVFLAAVKQFNWQGARRCLGGAVLRINAWRLSASAVGAMYQFDATAGDGAGEGELSASGRFSLMVAREPHIV
ncbi:hypothetical protein WKI13_06460 [Teredinibacter turnerae]|uniref:hypothetical protein n=1 Tax=Teredinibacter turnerae TaxID=2426 RepID=UPI001E63E5FB|nr:hypothetical protein [Teredinibacter turnerae]